MLASVVPFLKSPFLGTIVQEYWPKLESNIIVFPEWAGMMVLPKVKCSGGKLVSHSDCRIRMISRRTTIKEISFNVRTWNVRTLRQAG